MARRCRLGSDFITAEADADFKGNLVDGSNIESDVIAEFGPIEDNTNVLKATIKKLDKLIEKANLRLKNLQKPSVKANYESQGKETEYIKALDKAENVVSRTVPKWTKDRKINNIKLKKEKLRFQKMQELYELITDRFHYIFRISGSLAEKSEYLRNLRLVMHGNIPGGPRFKKMSVAEYNLPEINQLFNYLKSVFLHTDKAKDRIDKGKGLKNWHLTLSFPITAALKTDPTFKAFRVLDNLNKLPERIYTDYVGFLGQITTSLHSLNGPSRNIDFNVGFVNPDKPSPDEITANLENMNEFATKITDGTIRYIIPHDLDSKEFLEDKDRYIELLDYAIDSGLMVGKVLQQNDDGTVYVPIKQEFDESTGRRVWHVYQVPADVDDQGMVRRLYRHPDSEKYGLYKNSKKKMSEKDLDAYNKGRDKALNSIGRIATYTDDTGATREGIMKEGFYEASEYATSHGKKRALQDKEDIDIDTNKAVKKGQLYRYRTQHLSGYNLNENPVPTNNNKIPRPVWTHAETMTNILRQLAEIAAARIKATMIKRDKLLNKIKSQTNRQDITDLINAIDSFNLNVAETIDDDGNSHYVGSNNELNTIDNYFPWLRELSDRVVGFQRVIEDLQYQLKGLEEQLLADQENYQLDPDGENARYKDAGTTYAKSQASMQRKIDSYKGYEETDEKGVTKRVPGLIEINEYNLAVAEGKDGVHDQDKLPVEVILALTRHRSGMLSPLPEGKYGGIRRDMHVITDFFERTFKNINQNEMLTEMVGQLHGVSKDVRDYTVDTVKRGFGHFDTDAGFLFVPYSNKNVVNILNNIRKLFRLPPISKEDIHRISKVTGVSISAALLNRISSALMNGTQKFNFYVEREGVRVMEIAEDLQVIPEGESQSIADRMVAQTGVTNLIAGLADHLLLSLEGGMSRLAPLWTYKDLLKFQLSRSEFVKWAMGTERIKKFYMKLAAKRSKTKGRPLEELADLLVKGNWELFRGIAKGSVDTKKIKKLLGKTHTANEMTKIISWALQGGWIGVDIREANADALTFKGSEEILRRNALIDGSITFVDRNKNWLHDRYAFYGEGDPRNGTHVHIFSYDVENPDERYLAPESLAAGRSLVHATMFLISSGSLPNFMTGAVGSLFFKFWPYKINQAVYMAGKWNQWRLSQKGLPLSNKLGSFSRIAGISPLGPVRNWSNTDVQVELGGPAEVAVAQYFWLRQMSTLLWEMVTYVPIITQTLGMTARGMKRVVEKMIGRSTSLTFERGFRDPATVAMYRWAYLAYLLSAGWEDDEDIYDASKEFIREFGFFGLSTFVEAFYPYHKANPLDPRVWELDRLLDLQLPPVSEAWRQWRGIKKPEKKSRFFNYMRD